MGIKTHDLPDAGGALQPLSYGKTHGELGYMTLCPAYCKDQQC